MKTIRDALESVYGKTGIAAAVYSAFGELLGFTGQRPVGAFALPPEETFAGDLAQYGGSTFLRVKRANINYYIMLDGSDAETKNYALLMGELIGSEEERFISGTTAEEKIKLLLSGEVGSVRGSLLKAYFSETEFRHYMLSISIRTPDATKNVRHFLEAVASEKDFLIGMDDRTIVYLRYCGSDDAYRSADEFASVLYENIKEELRVELTIATGGTVHDVGEIAEGYERLIYTYKYGRMLNPESDIYAYKDYVLMRMLADVPKPTLMKYYSSLIERRCEQIINDDELKGTADKFMKNSLNISETGRLMYIHRNTLIYRLDKMEKDTGLNLRNFDDAVTFRLIEVLSMLIKGD